MRPNRTRRRSRQISEPELEILYNTPKSLRDRVIVALGKDTPLRRVDITRIRIEYFDFQTNRLFFPLQRKTKTPVGILLSNETVGRIKTYIFEKLGNKEKGYLFPSYRNKDSPISERQFSNWFKKIVEECNLKDITLHDLRATFLTRGGASGIPSDMMEQITGTSQKTINKHYTNYSQEQIDKLIKKLHGDG